MFYGYLPLANQVADGKIYIISCGTYVYHTHDHTFSRMQTDRDYDFPMMHFACHTPMIGFLC